MLAMGIYQIKQQMLLHFQSKSILQLIELCWQQQPHKDCYGLFLHQGSHSRGEKTIPWPKNNFTCNWPSKTNHSTTKPSMKPQKSIPSKIFLKRYYLCQQGNYFANFVARQDFKPELTISLTWCKIQTFPWPWKNIFSLNFTLPWQPCCMVSVWYFITN